MEETTQSPNEILHRRLPAKELSADIIMSLNDSMRPSAQEIAGMSFSIRSRKNWPAAKFAALLGVEPYVLRQIEELKTEATITQARLIWMFYMLDVSPERAMDIVHVAMWGKIDYSLPLRPKEKNPKARDEEIIKWINDWPNNPEYDGHPLSIRAIMGKWKVSYYIAHQVCRSIKYRFAKAQNKSYLRKRIPDTLKPHSIWLRVDWRNSNRVIAEQMKVAVTTVELRRRTFRHIRPFVLRKHLIACGIENLDYFEPILKNFLPKRAKRQFHRASVSFENNI